MSAWSLEVTSFRGYAWNGVHFYGKVVKDDTQYLPKRDQRIEFEARRELSAEDAKRLNEKDDVFSLVGVIGDGYQAGELTNRFDTEDEATAAGIALFMEHAAPGDILYRGSSLYSDRDVAASKR